MTSVVVSGSTPTLQQFPTVKSKSSPMEGQGVSPPNAGADLSGEAKAVAVDTVDISAQSVKTVAEIKKDEQKKETVAAVGNSERPDRAMAKVQFVYSPKGDLSIRYMDTADRLIYQVPSELMLRFAEALSKSDSSVNTKA